MNLKINQKNLEKGIQKRLLEKKNEIEEATKCYRSNQTN